MVLADDWLLTDTVLQADSALMMLSPKNKGRPT